MIPLLSAQAASYAPGGRAIVDSASLDLVAGRLTVIAGPNGAGKTTLFRLLSGELEPTSGMVLCDGERLERLPPWLLACKRAVLTQAVRLSFPFTVLEVGRLGISGIGRVPANAQPGVVERCLARAGVLHLAGRRLDTLSGGEQRRVHFARTLAQIEAGATVSDRQALLLDEPVANLDLAHQLALMDAAREAADSGLAVLAILHDLNLAARFADELVLMRDGAIAASGPPSRVLGDDVVSEIFGLALAVVETEVAEEPLVLPRRWVHSQ